MSTVEVKSEKVSEEVVSNLLSVNSLRYLMAKNVSIIELKTHQTEKPKSSSAVSAGGSIEFLLQAGRRFIDPQQTYMSFDVQTDTEATFGVGSALNCFQDSVARHRSGVDVSTPEGSALWNKTQLDWKCSPDYSTTVLPYMGQGATSLAVKQSFSIPAKYLWSCFDTDVLLPPQMHEGMDLRLSVANLNDAVVSVVAATTITITNVVLNMSVVTLYDQFQRKIDAECAQRGLALLHKEIYNQYETGTTSFSFQVRRAVAKAKSCHLIPRLSANINSATVLLDSMSSIKCPVTTSTSTAQCKIGSDYYPKAPIPGGINNYYAYALQAWKLMHQTQICPRVQYSYVVADNTYFGDALSKFSQFGMHFDFTSDPSILSGVSMNNSRALNFDIKFDAGTAANQIDIYLVYVRSCIYYPSNCEVSN